MKLAQTFAGADLAAIKAALDGGKLVLYSVARPDSPDKPIERSGILATFAFATPAFGVEDAAVAANFEANPVTATGVGTPGFARAYQADGVTPVADFSVGPLGEIRLSEISTVPNFPIAVTAFRLALPVEAAA